MELNRTECYQMVPNGIELRCAYRKIGSMRFGPFPAVCGHVGKHHYVKLVLANICETVTVYDNFVDKVYFPIKVKLPRPELAGLLLC